MESCKNEVFNYEKLKGYDQEVITSIDLNHDIFKAKDYQVGWRTVQPEEIIKDVEKSNYPKIEIEEVFKAKTPSAQHIFHNLVGNLGVFWDELTSYIDSEKLAHPKDRLLVKVDPNLQGLLKS